MALTPLSLALCDAPPSAPEYVVEGLLERGAVAMLSGDTGTSKSMVALSICVAVARGEPWLGRGVERGRVVYSDAEMVERLAVERLRGFGVRGADADSLTYLNRAPMDLTDPASADALRDLCRKRQPNLLVLDAVAGHVPGIDPNDNSAVVALYTDVLRPLAAELNLALLLTHHEGKSRLGPRNASLAALGARQWVGQADVQFTLERAPAPNSDVHHEPDGAKIERYRVRLRTPKRRDAADTGRYEPLCVVSRHHPDGALDSIGVEREASRGTAAGDSHDHRQELAERIAGFVKRNGESTTAEIAAAVDADSRNGSFKRALALATKTKLVTRRGKGVYR